MRNKSPFSSALLARLRASCLLGKAHPVHQIANVRVGSHEVEFGSSLQEEHEGVVAGAFDVPVVHADAIDGRAQNVQLSAIMRPGRAYCGRPSSFRIA
jgi:hypothetical protein